MVNRAVAEEAARGQARVPRADDDRGYALDGVAPQATSTVTFVGLVSASKTAERFWDWATSASMSSFDASASMWKVTLMSLKPLRTSLSAPRIPRMSWAPSTVDSTERSWMPRFCATDATPAVRQLARPTSRYSIGVMPLSVAAKITGWSASKVDSSLCFCSSPRPKKLSTLIWLCTPVCHLADARQVNWAASGAPLSTSRASSSAWTFTPLVTAVMSESPRPFPGGYPYCDGRDHN